MDLADLPSHEGKSVALIGMGRSVYGWMACAGLVNGKPYDEVWAINHLGRVLRGVDLIIHMDDMAHDAALMSSMYGLGIPILTSDPHGYEHAIAYPLQAVIDDVKVPYLNTTIAYAIAFAILRRVGTLTLFGCDFTGPDNTVHEEGRPCAEFWLGYAFARGVDICVVKGSTLMNHHLAWSWYGYAADPGIAIRHARNHGHEHPSAGDGVGDGPAGEGLRRDDLGGGGGVAEHGEPDQGGDGGGRLDDLRGDGAGGVQRAAAGSEVAVSRDRGDVVGAHRDGLELAGGAAGHVRRGYDDADQSRRAANGAGEPGR